MSISEILQSGDTLIVFRSQDIPQLAEELINRCKPNVDHQVTVKEVRGPVSQSDAIKELKRSRQTLVKWRKKGYLKGFLIGGRVFFKREEIDALLQHS